MQSQTPTSALTCRVPMKWKTAAKGVVSVFAALLALSLLATSFPALASWIFLAGTPAVVVGAALGAKLVQLREKTTPAGKATAPAQETAQ